MGQLLGLMMFGGGLGTVFITALLALGGIKVVISIVLPIAMNFIPQDEPLSAWVVLPMDMGIVGTLSNVGSLSEDGYLAAGTMDFFVTTSPTSLDEVEEPVEPAVYMQEDGGIDVPSRYVMRAGPLNYASIFCWFLAFGSLGMSGLAILILLVKDGPKEPVEDEKAAIGSASNKNDDFMWELRKTQIHSPKQS